MTKCGMVVLLVSITLAGCAPSTQHPVAIAGSKSDATIVMAAEFSDGGEVPNWAGAQATAEDRCAAWGYSGAEPLGSVFSSCTSFGAYGSCNRTRQTMTFQCLGGTTILPTQ